MQSMQMAISKNNENRLYSTREYNNKTYTFVGIEK